MTGHNTGVAGKRGNSIRGNGQKARRSALSLCAAAATVSALGIFAPKARAANVTWLGNNSGSWSDSGNWTTLPASGDSLIFGVAGPNGSSLSDDLITPGTFSDLTFTSAAPGYSIFPSSGNGFTLTGSIFNNSASAQSIYDNIALGTAGTGGLGYAPMIAAGSGGVTLAGTLSGAGGLALYGTGTVTLGGTDTYTGLTMVDAGTLASGTNSISSSSSLVIGGGTFQSSGQTFASTYLNSGQSRIVGTSGTTGLGSITQSIGGTADFTVPGGGAITTSLANTNGILGGWATIGNNLSSNSTGDWAANDGSGNIIAYTGYTPRAAAAAETIAAGNYSTQNWKTGALNGTNFIATVGASTTTPVTTVNSIVVQGDFSITSGQTLSIGSGGLMLKGVSRWILDNGAGNITSTTAILTSGAPSGELFVHVPDNGADGNNWRIWPIIANNGATPVSLVKDGAGPLKLEHSGSSFTGNIVINNGTLYADRGLGSNPTTSMWGSLTPAQPRQIIVNNGGVLSFSGGNVMGTGGSTNSLANVFLQVNPGGVFQTGLNGSGAGSWNKIGTVTLNNGTIHVGSGANTTNFQALALIGGVNVVGNAPSIIDNFAAANPASANIHLGQNTATGQSIVFNVGDVTGDSNVDLSVAPGLVNTSSNSIASGLTKWGNGTMVLSGASAYTGTTTVGNGILQVGNGTTGTLSATAPLALAGTGTFKFQSTSAGSSQTVGATTFASGDGTIQSTYGTSGNASLTLTSLARTAGGAGNFIVSGGANGSTNKIAITGATANALINSGVYFGGSDFAAFDSGLFVRALAYGSDANTSAVDTIAAGTNVKLTATPAAQSSISLNTLNLAGSGTSLNMSSGQTLTLGGGGLIKSGGGAAATISSDTGVTTGAAVELVVRTDTAGDSLNIAAPILNTSTAGLTKSGLGTLTLSGAGNAYTGTTTVDGGTLTLAGTHTGGGDWTVRNSGTLNINAAVTNGGVLNVAPVGGGVAIANINAPFTMVNGKQWVIGNSGGMAVANVTANISGGNSSMIAGNSSGVGVMNVTAGAVTPGQYFLVGTGSTVNAGGVVNVSGTGAINQINAAATISIGQSVNQYGILNISGNGSVSSNAGTGIHVGEDATGGAAGNTATGILNIWGNGTASFGGNVNVQGLRLASNWAATGIVNLGAVSGGGTGSVGGGTITTNVVSQGGGSTPIGTGSLNFHGGTLKASLTPNTAFMTGLTGAFVYGEGGTIDNSGQTITIGQSLLTPTANGVSNLTLSGVTKGFTPGATPIVALTGGGGIGASAISNVDANGNLTLTITNPGSGYTSAPVVNIYGGTGAGQAFAVATLAPNVSSGAMTFTGTGTTTIGGANTYAGLTTVAGGTLRVTGSLAGAASVSGGAAIGGTGTIAGPISLASGSTAGAQGAVKLVDGALGTLTGGGLTVGGSSANLSLLSFDAGASNTGDLLALGSGTFTENAGGANITINNFGGALAAGETINLITFANGAGAGFTLGSGTTVGGLTLTNPALSFGVTGTLNVTSTAVQLITGGVAPSNSAFWLGDKGTTWASADGAGGNFSSDKAGNTRLQSLPSITTDVTFAATPAINSSTLTNTLGQDFSIKSLTFDSDTAAANITGANTLTIGSGGILVKSGNGGATLGMTTLAAGASQTWENDSANDLVVGANITLAGGNALTLNSTAAGKIVLSGTNAYAGNTAITGGTVQAGSTGALSANSAYTLANGTTLNLNNFNNSVGSLAGSGNVTLGSGTLTAGANNSSTTYSGAISGTGGLTKSGTGTLTLSGSNSYTGNTTIAAGGTLQIGDGTTDGLIASSANIINAGTLLFNRVGNSFTYGGVISGAGTLVKTGPGTQSLSGANAYSGTTIVNNGTLAITGGQTGTQSTSANSDIQLAPTATDVAMLNVGSATLLANRVIIGGNSGNTGTPGTALLTQNGGTINAQQWFTVGSGSTTTNTTGTYNLSAGTLNEFSQTMEIGNFGGTQGTVNLSGTGAIRLYTNSAMALGANNSAAAGTVNQTGGTVAMFSDQGTTSGGSGVLFLGKATTSTGLFTYNLAGGTLTINQINHNAGTGNLNFHGGTLAAAKDQPSFFNGLSAINVYGEGATIDGNGHAITLGQPLAAPGGSGLSSVALGAAGSGYAFAPTVLITGGGGVGATANAVVTGGVVTGFTITNPGTGYTGTPSVALTGGGGSGASAGTINLAANTGGGVTFQNSGANASTVSLSAVNTYTGASNIIGGTVILSGSGSINGSSAITVNGSGAKFVQASATALTPNITVTNGTVDAAGTVGTVSIADSASNTIANGNGTSTTAFNATGPLSFGGNATANLRTAYGGGTIASSARVSSTSLLLQQTNAAGKVTINLNNSDSVWVNGDYDLFGYPTGSGPTGLSNAQVANLFTLGSITGATLNPVRNQVATLSNETVGGNSFIALTITGDSPVWTGIVSGNWTTNAIPPDAGGNKNWRIGAAPVDFLAGDTVIFDDTAAGTTNVDIADASVSPGAVTFNNSSKTYTVGSSGGFAITGSGLISKMGSGTVTINTNNSYTGGTAVSGGTLIMNGANTWGAGNVLVSGGTLTLNGANTYTGGTTLSGTGTLNVNNAGAIGTGALAISGGTLDNTSGGPITTTAAQPSTWSGNFAFAGTNNLSFSPTGTTAGTVTLAGGGAVTATMNAAALTVGHITSTNTDLTVAGGGTLAILDAALSNIGGTLTVNGNLQYATGTTAATANDFVATGLAGSGTISTGNTTTERWVYVNTTANNTFNGTVTGNAGVYKGGAANSTLTMAGTSNNTGTNTVASGTLDYAGTLNAGGLISVGSGNGNAGGVATPTAILKIDPSSNITANRLLVGVQAFFTGSAVYQTGGSLTLTQAAGVNNLSLGSIAGGYGYYNMSGGTLTTHEIDAGGNFNPALGVMDVAGGTTNVGGWICIARGQNSSGTMNVTGGTVNFATTSADNGHLSLNAQNFNAGGTGTAVLNVASGGSVVGPDGASGVIGDLNLMDANGAANFSAVNLLPGGTLQVNSVTAGNAAGTSHLNFNGGTLKATATNFGANFLNSSNITAVNVYAGGGTINNNGTNISIVNPIVAPTGNGVTTVTASGTGYVGAPMVTFSGGGGVGASGYATINPATGNLTGITVTSPGSGYTSQPSVTLTGGGGTPVSPTASIAANAASGPMTFTGSGVTTIAPAAGSATSTGLNNVVVAGGTLKINAAPTPVAAYTFDNIGTQQNPNYDLSNHGSGQSMDGSVSGSVDFSLAGHNGSGNAATFGGDGSSININSGITDLSGTSRWSVAYWVKAASSGAGGAIFSKNTGGSWAAGNSVFYLTDTSATGGTSGSVPGAVRNNAQWIKGSTSVTDDSWHFVVMNDDGGTRSVYVDGAVSAISQDTFTGADAGTSVQLGTSTDTNSADGAFPLLGSLDSVKFYNQSLTGAQILELMNTDTVGSVPTPSLPVTAAVNISTSGATLDVGASATIGSLSGVSGGSVVLEAGTFSVGDSTSTAFAGAISGAGSLLKQGSGTLTLSGSNTYGGNTTVNAGTLAVTASGSLPSTTNLAASGGAVVLGNASQTVASLSGSTGGSLTLNGTALTVSNGGTFAADWNAGSSPSSITVSGGTMAFGGATASNGTVNANAAATFAGTTGSTAVTRSLAALNIGDGVTVGILHSAFPFTPTILKPATTSFGAGSTIDISNNELVSNGTAAAALLKLQSGQIFSSEPADTTKAIGYINLSGADAGKFEVRYTLKGDANLDGSVAVGDLGALATSYGITTGMSWGNGDFNRDGKVDVGDLGALATNYGTHLATGPSAGDSAASAAAVASPMALVASGGSAAVPEPASGALLGIAALGLIGGRRRRHRSLN